MTNLRASTVLPMDCPTKRPGCDYIQRRERRAAREAISFFNLCNLRNLWITLVRVAVENEFDDECEFDRMMRGEEPCGAARNMTPKAGRCSLPAETPKIVTCP